MNSRLRRFWPLLALLLVLAELLLVLLSWILSAAMPMSGVRSMLSGEGIRWFLGHFADVLATPVLVWLLLLAMAYGSIRHCGIFEDRSSYRSRRAVWISALYLIIYIGVVLLMAVVPHAVLLSATGNLWPSPFSASLVPVIAFGLLSMGVVYGVVAGTFLSFSDVYDSLVHGIRQSAPLLLFYILTAQLYYALRFVFP